MTNDPPWRMEMKKVIAVRAIGKALFAAGEGAYPSLVDFTKEQF